MIEKYYKYCIDYRNNIILMKIGNFYECIDNDALLMNHLFHYKIKRLNNNLKVGFPIIKLDSIVEELNSLNINYIVINKEIKKHQEFSNNQYDSYKFDKERVLSLFYQLERITNYIEENIMDEVMEDRLKKIESTLKCK